MSSRMNSFYPLADPVRVVVQSAGKGQITEMVSSLSGEREEKDTKRACLNYSCQEV